MYLEDELGQEVFALEPNSGWRSFEFSNGEPESKFRRFKHPDSELPSAMLYHDSFGRWIMDFMREDFSQLTCLSKSPFDLGLIIRERPDVVIELIVERQLTRFSPFQPTLTGQEQLARDFAASDNVLLTTDISGGNHGLEPFMVRGKGPRTESQGEDLVVHVTGPSDRILLPDWKPAPTGIPVLYLELDSPADTVLQFVYQIDEPSGKQRAQILNYPVVAGENRLWLDLKDPQATGAFLLGPGLAPGIYRLREYEVRSVEAGDR